MSIRFIGLSLLLVFIIPLAGFAGVKFSIDDLQQDLFLQFIQNNGAEGIALVRCHDVYSPGSTLQCVGDDLFEFTEEGFFDKLQTELVSKRYNVAQDGLARLNARLTSLTSEIENGNLDRDQLAAAQNEFMELNKTVPDVKEMEVLRLQMRSSKNIYISRFHKTHSKLIERLGLLRWRSSFICNISTQVVDGGFRRERNQDGSATVRYPHTLDRNTTSLSGTLVTSPQSSKQAALSAAQSHCASLGITSSQPAFPGERKTAGPGFVVAGGEVTTTVSGSLNQSSVQTFLGLDDSASTISPNTSRPGKKPTDYGTNAAGKRLLYLLKAKDIETINLPRINKVYLRNAVNSAEASIAEDPARAYLITVNAEDSTLLVDGNLSQKDKSNSADNHAVQEYSFSTKNPGTIYKMVLKTANKESESYDLSPGPGMLVVVYLP